MITRRAWMALIALLILSLAAEMAVSRHPHFGLDAVFGFYAWFAAAACVLLVIVAKVIGVFLKRRDTYYDD